MFLAGVGVSVMSKMVELVTFSDSSTSMSPGTCTAKS